MKRLVKIYPMMAIVLAVGIGVGFAAAVALYRRGSAYAAREWEERRQREERLYELMEKLNRDTEQTRTEAGVRRQVVKPGTMWPAISIRGY